MITIADRHFPLYIFCVIIYVSIFRVLSFMLSFDVIIYCYHLLPFFFFLKTWHTPEIYKCWEKLRVSSWNRDFIYCSFCAYVILGRSAGEDLKNNSFFLIASLAHLKLESWTAKSRLSCALYLLSLQENFVCNDVKFVWIAHSTHFYPSAILKMS